MKNIDNLKGDIILVIKQLYISIKKLKRTQQILERECKSVWSQESQQSYNYNVIECGMEESYWSLYHNVSYVKANHINRNSRKRIMKEIKLKKGLIKELNRLIS